MGHGLPDRERSTGRPLSIAGYLVLLYSRSLSFYPQRRHGEQESHGEREGGWPARAGGSTAEKVDFACCSGNEHLPGCGRKWRVRCLEMKTGRVNLGLGEDEQCGCRRISGEEEEGRIGALGQNEGVMRHAAETHPQRFSVPMVTELSTVKTFLFSFF